MSGTSISRAANDAQLRERVDALTHKLLANDDTLRASDFGQRVLGGYVMASPLYWAVAVDTEDAYAEALLGGNGSPGYDETVISDDDITTSITAHWPADPATTPPVAP